jgi:hypothetical protein
MRRPLTSAVVLLATLASLAACSPSEYPDPEPTRSEEEVAASYGARIREQALITPEVPVPAGLAVAAPGTSVPVGEWLAVPMTGDDGATWTVALRVTPPVPGVLERDFSGFDEASRADLAGTVPMYVTVEFSRLSGDPMSSDPYDVRVLLTDGTVEPHLTVVGGLNRAMDTPFCVPALPAVNVPDEVGDVFGGCEMYAVPEGLGIAAVEWSDAPGYADAPVRWTL